MPSSRIAPEKRFVTGHSYATAATPPARDRLSDSAFQRWREGPNSILTAPLDPIPATWKLSSSWPSNTSPDDLSVRLNLGAAAVRPTVAYDTCTPRRTRRIARSTRTPNVVASAGRTLVGPLLSVAAGRSTIVGGIDREPHIPLRGNGDCDHRHEHQYRCSNTHSHSPQYMTRLIQPLVTLLSPLTNQLKPGYVVPTMSSSTAVPT